MTGISDDPDLAEFLRLKECRYCGYLLESLPAEGSCPECGHRYSAKYCVLRGIRGSTNGSFAFSTPILNTFALCFVLVGLHLSRSSIPGIHSIFGAPFEFLLYAVVREWPAAVGFFSCLLSIGLECFLIWRLPFRPRTELWISRDGIAQIRAPLEARRVFRFIGFSNLLFYLQIFCLAIAAQAHSPHLAAVAAVIAIAEVGALWTIRAAKPINDPCVPDLAPWSSFDWIKLDVLYTGCVRIRCGYMCRLGKVKLPASQPIDFKVLCPEGLEQQLAAVPIESWSDIAAAAWMTKPEMK